MRDLARFPITLDEARDAVERSASEYFELLQASPGEAPLGDIRGVALLEAARLLKWFSIEDAKVREVRTLIAAHRFGDARLALNDAVVTSAAYELLRDVILACQYSGVPLIARDEAEG